MSRPKKRARNGKKPRPTTELGEGHLHFRVGHALSVELDAFAERAKVSRSEAARMLLSSALGDAPRTAAMIGALEELDARLRELLEQQARDFREELRVVVDSISLTS